MRICLINAYPLKEMGIVGQIYPPLGVLYLASYARSRYPHLEFLVIDGYRTRKRVLFEKVFDFKPDVVGVSMTSPSSTGAYDVINEIKKELGEGVLVLSGGPHPSITSVEPLTRSLSDYVVRGEGEIVFSEIIGCLFAGKEQDIKKIKSVSYRYDGEIIDNPLMPLIKNISEIPFPARDLLDITDYPGYHYKKRKRDTSLVSSRGCPHQCLYCSNPVWKLQTPWFRTRSPEDVVNEMEWIVQHYGITEFYDQTDQFNGDLRWAKATCDEIIRRKLNVVWKVQMRADHIDDELGEKMAKAGCWLGLFGIETGNDETSSGVGKKISRDQSKRTLRLMKKNNMKTAALLMAFNVWEEEGILKFEDQEKTRETMRFAESLVKDHLVDFISWSLTTPYPGSQLFQIALRHKIIPEELIGRWENWDSSANFIMRLPGITERDWLNLQRKGKWLQVKLLLKSGSLNAASLPVYLRKISRMILRRKTADRQVWKQQS